MFGGNMPSLADIAAVSGKNNDNDNFGNNGAWWIIVIVLVLFGALGNRGGFGAGTNDCGNGSNGGGTTVVYDTGANLQRGFDTQNIISKLDGINNGICSLGYDQLSQMNGINGNISQTGFAIQQAVNADTVANMQNTNMIGSKIDNCCCQNREAIAQVRYDMATDTCAITNAINQASQAQIQNCNANYRQLHDEIVQIQIDNLKEKNAEQASLITALNLSASQANQNQYLIDRLQPNPRPAFVVPNPFAVYGGGYASYFGNQNAATCNC